MFLTLIKGHFLPDYDAKRIKLKALMVLEISAKKKQQRNLKENGDELH